MSEKPTTKPAKEKTENKKETKDPNIVSAPVAKVIKAEWTLERCKRYARRFPTEAIWASAAQASYKAAVARGWRDECLAEQGKFYGTPTKRAA